jgi:hypothetical protein
VVAPIVTWKKTHIAEDDYRSDNESVYLMRFLALFLAVIAGCVALLIIVSNVTSLMNPEWTTLMRLIGK